MVDHKHVIASIRTPENQRQLQGFLGMLGFCHIWIPDFGLIAKPLYDSLKGIDTEPLEWETGYQRAFETLKEKLISSSALGLLLRSLSNCIYLKSR